MDKTIAVVGGGDAAVEEAMFLTRFARKIFLIHRRGELRATKIVQQRVMKNDKIEFLWHSAVKNITCQTVVESLLNEDVRNKKTSQVDVEGIFIYAGQQPNSHLIVQLAELDEQGFVVTDENMGTQCPGLFAAGDVRKKLLRQVVTAVSDGAIAAVSVVKYLEQIK
jgi:thioredoxin reductase (NADPH)